MDRSPLVVGIAGGTGSGKTTLANKLKAAIAEDALILSHDFYYRANTEIPFEERAKRNYDHPDAFDTDQMITDVKKLKNFQAVDHPEYSFVTHSRTEHTVHVAVSYTHLDVYKRQPLRPPARLHLHPRQPSSQRSMPP